MNNKTALALAASIVPVLAWTAIRGYAQSDAPTVLKGRDAFGSWRDDRPGLRRLFNLGDLPPIGENTGDHYSQVVPRPAGAMPQVPRGFTIAQVASGLKEPRVIRTAPNGDLFVSDSAANVVRVYRVPAKSSKPQTSAVFRDRPQTALWHRLLPARRQSALGLRRQRERRGALSLQIGRSQGARPGSDHCFGHSRGAPLDARHRFYARRQDDVFIGR